MAGELEKTRQRAVAAEQEAEHYANKCGDLRRQLDASNDRIDFMQGEYDAAVRQHLEQDTWARMEIEKWKAEANAANVEVGRWMNEAKKWAGMFARNRTTAEDNQRRVWVWVKELQGYARGMFVIDIILILGAFAVILGIVPPMFADLPWWWK